MKMKHLSKKAHAAKLVTPAPSRIFPDHYRAAEMLSGYAAGIAQELKETSQQLNNAKHAVEYFIGENEVLKKTVTLLLEQLESQKASA